MLTGTPKAKSEGGKSTGLRSEAGSATKPVPYAIDSPQNMPMKASPSLDASILLITNLSVAQEKFNGSIDIVRSENLAPVYLEGMLDTCLNLSELLEQLCVYGRNYIKAIIAPQLSLIISNLQEFDKLVMKNDTVDSKFMKIPMKGSKTFPYVKFSPKKKVAQPIFVERGVNVDSNTVLVYARVIESLFISRILIIEIQYDVLNDDSMNHEEQVNRMEILIHTISKLDPYNDDSQDEILVCLGLLDNFAIDYFKLYGGHDSGNEISNITRTVWEMEKSLSYGRKQNGHNRLNCVKAMQDIMVRVKQVSKQKSDDSLKKLKGKLKMLVSAREQALSQWHDLELKYGCTQLTQCILAFKTETFDAEHRLVNKIEKQGHNWKMRAEPDIVDGQVFVSDTTDNSTVMSFVSPKKYKSSPGVVIDTKRIDKNNVISKMLDNWFGIKLCTSISTGPESEQELDAYIKSIANNAIREDTEESKAKTVVQTND